jgi:hypothetical protein
MCAIVAHKKGDSASLAAALFSRFTPLSGRRTASWEFLVLKPVQAVAGARLAKTPRHGLAPIQERADHRSGKDDRFIRHLCPVIMRRAPLDRFLIGECDMAGVHKLGY